MNRFVLLLLMPLLYFTSAAQFETFYLKKNEMVRDTFMTGTFRYAIQENQGVEIDVLGDESFLHPKKNVDWTLELLDLVINCDPIIDSVGAYLSGYLIRHVDTVSWVKHDSVSSFHRHLALGHEAYAVFGQSVNKQPLIVPLALIDSHAEEIDWGFQGPLLIWNNKNLCDTFYTAENLKPLAVVGLTTKDEVILRWSFDPVSAYIVAEKMIQEDCVNRAIVIATGDNVAVQSAGFDTGSMDGLHLLIYDFEYENK